ncbi:sensor histidine kinase [Microbacterium aquimaris]|uniref:Signal transduction histidine kinase n=1 Tax=Microbacterium aquimaris TaxID=459816 RepID=A0ABU5N5D1_9MICO|nr:hypothetical protein [Microbacterium aquimaris]MDZ8161293.1 hypothetical protein [Microbacterium aquimaris]
MPHPEPVFARARVGVEKAVRRARNVVVRGSAIWWDAVSGGAFYNTWSTGLSFVLATFISVPTFSHGAFEGYAKAVVVAAISWVVLAILVAPAAFAERRLPGRVARASTVLVALVVASCLRTPLNDLLGHLLWATSSEGDFGPRIATNITWALLLFSLVAVTHTQYAQRRVTTERLENALATMRTRLARARAQSESTRALLADTAHRLRDAREQLLAGDLDFDAVRAYADQVRAESHLIERRADDVAEEVSTPEGRDRPSRPHRSLSERLVATPRLVVALLYVAGTVPFSFAAGGAHVVLVGAVGIAAIDLAAGAVVRRVIPPRGARHRAPLYIAVWLIAGVAACAMTYALVPGIGVLGLTGMILVPGMVVALALCIDAIQEAREVARRSEELLPQVAREAGEETSRAIDPLRAAVDLLHGGVQGRCVVFAAHVDEGQATERHVADFRRLTDDIFDRLLDEQACQAAEEETGIVLRETEPGAGPIERILGAWGAIMEISVRTSDRAAVALTDAATADQVVDVVNEALVNAVKHSGARAALVRLTVAADGRLRVRAISRGTLSDPDAQRPGIGTSSLDATVTQSGDDVVFDARLPWRDPAAMIF